MATFIQLCSDYALGDLFVDHCWIGHDNIIVAAAGNHFFMDKTGVFFTLFAYLLPQQAKPSLI